MKIKQIKISQYGHFQDFSLDFDPDFQIIKGLNESGKSTIRSFITDIFFGFDKGSIYAPLKGKTFGGQMTVTDDGIEYDIKRFRGSDIDLEISKDGVAIDNPAVWLENKLSPFDKKTFTQIFSLSQEELVNIDNIKGQELEDIILQIGSADGPALSGLSAEQDKLSSDIYKKTGRNQIVAELMSKHEDLQNELEALKQEYSKYESDRQQLAAIDETYEKLNADYTNDTKQLESLKKLNALTGEYQELQQLLAQAQGPENQPEVSAEVKSQVSNQLLELQTRENKFASRTYDQNLLNNYLENKSSIDSVRNNISMIRDLTQRRAQLLMRRSEVSPQTPVVPETQPETNINVSATNKKNPTWLVISVLVIVLAGYLLTIGQTIASGVSVIAAVLGLFIWTKGNKDVTKTPEVVEQIQEQQPLEDNSLLLDQLTNDIQNYTNPLTAVKSVYPIENIQDPSQIQGYFDKLEQERQNKEDHDNLERDIQKIKLNLIEIWKPFNVVDTQQYQELLQRQDQQAQVQARIKTLQSMFVDDQIDQIKTLGEKPGIESKIEQLSSQIQATEFNEIKKQREDLKINLASTTKSQDILDKQQEIENNRLQLVEQIKLYLSHKLASQWIDNALRELTDARLPGILDVVNQYFSQITGGKYKEVQFTDKGIDVLDSNDRVLKASQLSRGAAEQLYILIRIGFAMQMNDIASFPIMIDDSFVNFDMERKQFMVEILNKMKQTYQVIYFTANLDLEFDGAKIHTLSSSI